jgi:hypothetical protein
MQAVVPIGVLLPVDTNRALAKDHLVASLTAS